MRRAAILAGVRTAIGRYGGSLAGVRPDDLAAHVLAEAIRRSRIDPSTIDDVYIGAANQSGEDNRNVARMAVLLANLPASVPGCTVNRLCASGLEAINLAARSIESGAADVVVAGGVESMTRAPFVLAKSADAWGRQPEIYDTTIGWRFTNPRLAQLHQPFSMGETAENVAEKHRVSREEQDRFALESQGRWKAAHDAGRFKDEIVAFPVPQKRGEPIAFEVDEHPRPETTLDQLAKLKPAFRSGGSVTAGNSSGVNDGAAALVLMEAKRAESLGLTPIGLVGPSASAGVDPALMGLGPIPATQKALAKAKLNARDISVVELNEAFAAQAIPCIRELNFDPAFVNPNGGAIAIGHPLGASGARLAITLLHELRRRKARYGLAALCVGVGQGVATVIEAV